MTNENIYLDYQATTPLDGRVLQAMVPWLELPANPHASENAFGRNAASAIELARVQVAEAVGGDPNGVVFTGSATESANIVVRSFATCGKRLLMSAIEHPCVAETARECERSGLTVVKVVPVDAEGLVDLDEFSDLIEDVDLVSIMSVNNEVGTIQPIEDIAALCMSEGIPLHTDASQAIGRVDVDMEVGISFVTLSSHKIYGPAGIGALCARPDELASLNPLMSGGGQEKGLRPGTLPTALCVGFGEACAIAIREKEMDEQHAKESATLFLEQLDKCNVSYVINGSRERRVAQNLNVSFDGVLAEELLARVPNVAASTGSACSSGAIGTSSVLAAMALDEDVASSAIRIGFGRRTDFDDVIEAATQIAKEASRLQGERGVHV